MKQDDITQVAEFWNSSAQEFDRIYSGDKGWGGRLLDRWLRKDMYQRFAWVMQRAGDVRGKSVCDLGCGSGRFVNELARSGARRVVGVDIAPEMLKLAGRLLADSGTTGVCELVHSDVLDWRTDEVFDISIAIGFWDYIADPLPRLRVIRKLTGEKFLSAWPRLWTWRVPIRKLRLTMEGCPVYFYSQPRVHHLLELAGFQVERFNVVGKLFCVQARPR